jgi:HK97 family phage prohead protease
MEYREFRAEVAEGTEGRKLTGLVTPFDRETTIGDLKRGGWTETARRGMFTKTLDEGDALMCYQHDLKMPMARKSAGNLDLAEGERDGQKGLIVGADPVDTSYTRDCMALVRGKVVQGMSFGFNVVKDKWTTDDGKPSDRMNGTRRELLEVQLIEVSPVTRPAYGGTSISARDEASALLEERQRAAEDQEEERSLADLATDYLMQRYDDLPEEMQKAVVIAAEARASSVAMADRKKLAAKGQALSDGSYPIPDVAHLHAAAVLAASGHGNWKAAKRLVRKMAKKFGVALGSLPGFSNGKKSGRAADGEPETRIKNGTAKRVLQIDAELKQALYLLGGCDLSKEAKDAMALVSSAHTHICHIADKENLSADDLSRSQEPESSTPDKKNDDALLASAALAMQRSRELGLS